MKTTAKLTFSAPLFSHYRLPLKSSGTVESKKTKKILSDKTKDKTKERVFLRIYTVKRREISVSQKTRVEKKYEGGRKRNQGRWKQRHILRDR